MSDGRWPTVSSMSNCETNHQSAWDYNFAISFCLRSWDGVEDQRDVGSDVVVPWSKVETMSRQWMKKCREREKVWRRPQIMIHMMMYHDLLFSRSHGEEEPLTWQLQITHRYTQPKRVSRWRNVISIVQNFMYSFSCSFESNSVFTLRCPHISIGVIKKPIKQYV